MEIATFHGPKWMRRWRLIWFVLVVGLSLALQILAELAFKGLGMGVALAVTGLTIAPFLALASMVLIFAGLVWSGFWRAVRAAGYAAIFHVLMTGWIWLTISTAAYQQESWLNENPRSAGALTLAAGALLLIALRIVSVRAADRA